MAEPKKEMTEDELDRFLRMLGQHLVSVIGWVEDLNDEGGVSRRWPYAISCTVVSHSDSWYLLTAGHAIEKYYECIQTPNRRASNGTLIFGFSNEAITHEGFIFNLVSRPKVSVHDERAGLDYALFQLTALERLAFEANGVAAYGLHVRSRQPESDFEMYYAFGLLKEANVLVTDDHDSVTNVRVQPDLIPVKRLPDDSGATHPWFKGYIMDLGDVKCINGVSGGPIFGIARGEREGEYRRYLIAIQSWWHKGRMLLYGCDIDAIYQHVSSLHSLTAPMVDSATANDAPAPIEWNRHSG